MSSPVKHHSVFDANEHSPPHSMKIRLWLARRWRLPKLVLLLIIFEIGPTIAALALYGIADPNLYRTKLWEDGSLNGFNSSPGELLLSYANHVKFNVPLVWSQYITTFNLIISVLSMFVLIVKSVAFVMHIWYPLLSLAVHSALFGLYLFSTYAQLSSDKSDPQRPQNGPPWYITKSCGVAYNPGNIGYCRQAKASAAVAIIMVVLFFTQMILALVSCFPTQAERRLRAERDSDPERASRPTHGIGGLQPPDSPLQHKSSFVAAHPLQSHQPQSLNSTIQHVWVPTQADRPADGKQPARDGTLDSFWASMSPAGRREKKQHLAG